jgi:hypothetical protein
MGHFFVVVSAVHKQILDSCLRRTAYKRAADVVFELPEVRACCIPKEIAKQISFHCAALELARNTSLKKQQQAEATTTITTPTPLEDTTKRRTRKSTPQKTPSVRFKMIMTTTMMTTTQWFCPPAKTI